MRSSKNWVSVSNQDIGILSLKIRGVSLDDIPPYFVLGAFGRLCFYLSFKYHYFSFL